MDFVFAPEPVVSLPILGSGQRFPVRRIYCVGRNYAEHVREMASSTGQDTLDNAPCEPPCFFTKPANAVVSDGRPAHYPPRTQNLHHEIELVVAIGKSASGIAADNAWDHLFGYAAGIDLTRRDLQTAAKKAGQPWDTGKAFDESAPVSGILPFAQAGELRSGRIWLQVNGETRQDSDIDQMIWGIPAIIAELASLFTLEPGDLVFTGTPAGVSAVRQGDVLEGGIEGVANVRVAII